MKKKSTKEQIELEKKKEQERTKFKENPFEIPEYMIKEFDYSPNIKEAIHLIPNEELIQKAFRSIVERYIGYVKEKTYRKIERMNFSNLEVVERSLLYREFSYIINKENTDEDTISHFGNQFVLTEAYDFKKEVGLINERKTFTSIGGWRYKKTYESFIYQYHAKKNTQGSFWMFFTECDESVTKLKINNYFTYEINPENLKYENLNLKWIQQVLDQDPEVTEVLFKMGYNRLVHRKMSKQKYDFLRKNKKSLPKTIDKTDFDLAFSIYKAGKDPKDYVMIKDTFGRNKFGQNSIGTNVFYEPDYNLTKLKKETLDLGYSYRGNTKISFSSTDAKVLYRVINLLNTGSTWQELNHFCGCCYGLELNQNEYIFKGRKEREAIVKEFESKISEIKREIRAEINEKKKKEKKILEKTTANFKELTVDGFLLKPLKTYKDFQETATKFRNCLMTNQFHLKVASERKIIYLAIPLGKKETEGEIISWNRSDTLNIDQIHGVQNTNTIYYEEIKKIALNMKLEDLLIAAD